MISRERWDNLKVGDVLVCRSGKKKTVNRKIVELGSFQTVWLEKIKKSQYPAKNTGYHYCDYKYFILGVWQIKKEK